MSNLECDSNILEIYSVTNREPIQIRKDKCDAVREREIVGQRLERVCSA